MSNEPLTHLPRLIVVAENPRQRLAFGEAVKACGYDLIDCVPSSRIDAAYLSLAPDLWLIDSMDDIHVINQLATHDKFLLGFTPAPEITNAKAYGKWQRHLKRKLTQVLGEVDPTLTPAQPKKIVNWHYVFVLGASMGGPKAVKAFLDNLPVDLPIALVLAQHNDAKAIQTLPAVLTRNNNWQCDVINSAETAMLTQGKLWVVPTDQKVAFEPTGEISVLSERWAGQYKPCISDVMLDASQVFGHRLITIVFSGMGDDGSDAAAFTTQQKSKVWTQSANSCECPSQPESVLQTGVVEFMGDPAQLAQRIIQHVTLYPTVH